MFSMIWAHFQDFGVWIITHCSLVPRPFPPPVFDRLQYANTKGEGLGDLVTCGTSGRQMVDTRGAVPDNIISSFVSNRPWRAMNDRWY